ncbi:hypothetical protein V5F40_21650 [Xanthobacter sp. DSM 14520]|uniref:hypothetical protein n=1 Tax=Xanthobacter autotrophicus (strain ATCC BAA-1158 / Py2) TaxID=78245 RepID=UPI0037297B64
MTEPHKVDLYNFIYSHPPGRRRALMQELMLKGFLVQQGAAAVLVPPPPLDAGPQVPPQVRPAHAVASPPVVPKPKPEPAKGGSGKLKLGAVKGFKA